MTCLAVATPASAGMRVEPMSYDLTASGDGARQDLRVENTGSSPVPVEVRVERREINPDGTDKRTPAEDDFLVFPPQGIVPPNGFQTFRIQYIGDATLARTSLYTVTVAQLPVEVSEQSSGVQLLFNLGTLAAVSPAGSEARIAVVSAEPATEAGLLQITVRNDGNRYTRLKQGSWTLTSGDGVAIKLEGMPLNDALPQPLIDAGSTRVIKLPVGADFKREGATAIFTPDAARP